MKQLVKILLLSMSVVLSVPSFAARNQVTKNFVATDTLTDNNLANGSVGTLEIKDNTIVDNDIASGTIQGTQLSSPLNFLGNISIPETKVFYLDGGSDTYLTSDSANQIDIMTGGTSAMLINNSGVGIFGARDLFLPAARKFYLDGGGDSYLTQTSDNNISIATGGTSAIDFNNTRVSLSSTRDLWLDPTKSLYLDGGVDTRIYQSSDNTIRFETGGTTRLTIFNDTQVFTDTSVDFAVSSGKKLKLDGFAGSDTYLTESAANIISVVAGGTESFSVNNSGVKIGNGATMQKYDEGTCTPTVTLVGGSGNTVPVYATNSCRWTRIGNQYFVDIYLNGDGGAEGAGTGQINIALPRISSANSMGDHFSCGGADNSTSESMLYCVISASSTTIQIYSFTSTNILNPFEGSDQNNTSRQIRLKFFYEI